MSLIIKRIGDIPLRYKRQCKRLDQYKEKKCLTAYQAKPRILFRRTDPVFVLINPKSCRSGFQFVG